MPLFLYISVAIRLAAFVWSIVLLLRLRDWRIGFLTLLLGAMFMALFLGALGILPLTFWEISLTRLRPGMVVSVATLLAVAFLERAVAGRQQAEETLRESEAKWRSLVENASDIVMTVEPDGTIVFINRTVPGITVEEAVGTSIYDYISPEYHRLVKECFERVIQTGEPDGYEIVGEGPHGTTSWYRSRLGPIRQGEQVVALSLITSDITDRKQAEEALKESEAQYRDLYENAPIAYCTVGLDGRIQRANRRAVEMFGYSPDELIGRQVLDLYADTPARKERAQALFQRFRAGEGIDGEELEVLRPDGRSRWISLTVRPVLGAEGEVVASRSMAVDITERKQTEQQQVRLERLRALGEMAQGVAHNFNNLLVGVLGYAQIIQMKSDDAQIAQDLEYIIESALRAKDLVERLNRAVQGEKGDTAQPVPVNEAVQEAVVEARPRWKDTAEAKEISIDVVTELEEVPPISGTQDRLQDMLVDLLFNAVDALPKGGTITIHTQAVDGAVQVTVKDTGVGMGEETRRRVFDPLFTTKADVGTGLGLSTVYNTITRWGGSIEVESSPGKGTAFVLGLPVWTGPKQEEAAEAGPRPLRRGKVLVVEDEEIVCHVLSDLLSEEHEVEVVSSGKEALDRFAPGRYDVALIDLGMPEMPGNRVAERMREADPLVVAVLVTGWDLEADDPRLAAFDFRLMKPFTSLERVLDVVSQAMALHDARVEA